MFIQSVQNLLIELRLILLKVHRCVHSETVHAHIQPEIGSIVQLLYQRLTRQVQIRHLRPEGAFIEPVRAAHPVIGIIDLLPGEVVILHIRTFCHLRLLILVKLSKI